MRPDRAALVVLFERVGDPARRAAEGEQRQRRAGGWTAHCLEQIAEDTLIRLQSVCTGARLDEWLPAQARG